MIGASTSGRRVLVLTTVLPSTLRGGGEIVSQAFVDAIRAAGHRTVVLGYRRPADAALAGAGEVGVGERAIETRDAGPAVLAWLGGALARGLPYSVAKYASRRYRDAVRVALEAMDPDLVVIDHAQMGWLAPDLRGRRFVHLAHNVEERLYASQARGSRRRLARTVYAREARLLGAIERRLAHDAREVWTLTESDAESFARRGARVRHFHVIPDLVAPPGAAAKRCDIGVLGSWTWEANRQGLEWFLHEVVPALPSHLVVRLAGRGGASLAAASPRVEHVGVVPDAAAFLAAARVVAVPSVAGEGIQVKTLDAIASGARVVSTPVGVRGLGPLPASVTVAADAAGFARELGRVASDPASMEPSADGIGWIRQRRAAFRSEIDVALRAS